MATKNTVVKSARPNNPNQRDTSAIPASYAPPSIPSAQTLRQLITELKVSDPGGTLKAELKALLG
jgi:hypothetical protein